MPIRSPKPRARSVVMSPSSQKPKETKESLQKKTLKQRIEALRKAKEEALKEEVLPVEQVPQNIEKYSNQIKLFQQDLNKKQAIRKEAENLLAQEPYELLYEDVFRRDNNTFVPAFANSIRDLILFKFDKYQKLSVDLSTQIDQLSRQQALLTEDEQNNSPDRYRLISLKSAVGRINELLADATSYKSIFFPTISDTGPEVQQIRDEIAGHKNARPAEAWRILIEQRLSLVMTSRQGFGGLQSDARSDIRNLLAKLIRSMAKGFQVFYRKQINIVLMGPPGIGKTTLARIIGFIMNQLIILFTSNFLELSASSFTAEFEGQTGPKTLSVLLNGLESVIFLDEAQNLPRCDPKGGPPSDKGYGADAITEIVQFMSQYKGLQMMIVAGQEKPMKECFLMSNEGFLRRFDPSYRIVLKPYGPFDLLQIFATALDQDAPDLSPLEKALLDDFFVKSLVSKDMFPNSAADVETLVADLTGSINNQQQSFSEMPDSKDTRRILTRLLSLEEGLNAQTRTKGYSVKLEGLKPSETLRFHLVPKTGSRSKSASRRR